jgi:UDP-N-acetylglucosamine 4,6-dehydratase
MRRNHFPVERFPEVRYFVGDVRDEQRLRRAFRGVDYVIHAAAMKHVDVAEYNPQECIATNIGGAENVINAAIDCGVKKVVALSTDKAAEPVNLYGATKLCSDKLFAAANSLSGEGGPRFAIVRYGNVWGSNGSVVPFFQKQASTGVLPITDPKMTRFIITLEQSVNLVLKAFEKMEGGEVFVPKIPSTTILDIARAVDPNCATKVIGIRPGEKLHECMIPADEARHTLEFDDHYIIQPAFRSWSNKPPAYLETGLACDEGFNYSSDNNVQWLTIAQLQSMILGDVAQPVNELEQVRNGAGFASPEKELSKASGDSGPSKLAEDRHRVTKVA